MVLKVTNLEKDFGGIKAVNNCNFEIKENKITTLIGPNGAGKTTVFNLITGLIKPDKGHIHFRGNHLVGLKPYKIARLGLTRTFQLIRLFPKLTAMENMLLVRSNELERFKDLIFNPKKIRHEENLNKQRCMEFLELVGIPEKHNFLAENLSFGQQKLLEIARALATESPLILLDEPVGGVNPKLRDKIRNILIKIKEQGRTLLIIEHDMNFVMKISDKVIVLDEGTVIAEGPPKKIQNNKKVLDAYLGGNKK
ncbi:ABC transporter ATP-binding protein [Candidatus Woesearchaeota archaeon]|nr:ABC transporter ATP-binding protein [Candidatus Woesearchaeota archaeon]